MRPAGFSGDRKNRTMPSKIPAETASFLARTVSPVWDVWMVVTIWTKLAAPHAVIDPVSETRVRNGIEGRQYFSSDGRFALVSRSNRRIRMISTRAS
jgi:hypothetical protein